MLCCWEMSTPVDVLFFVNFATVLNKYLGLCLFSSKRDEKWTGVHFRILAGPSCEDSARERLQHQFGEVQVDQSGNANRSTSASPKCLQISWAVSGWSRHSFTSAG